jgi:hypothetical protein
VYLERTLIAEGKAQSKFGELVAKFTSNVGESGCFQIEPLACVGAYRKKLIKCVWGKWRGVNRSYHDFWVSDFTKKLCALFHRIDYFFLHRTSPNIKQKAFVNETKSGGDNLWEWRSGK